MSLGAGMATGVGASLVMCTRTLDRGLLAYTLAFSAGVMSYVSLVEVVGVSTEYFEHGYASHVAYALGTASFFAGVTIMAIVDRVVHTVFDAIAAGHGHAHAHGHGHGHGHVASSASGAPGPGSRGGGEEEAGMLHEETPPSDLFEDEGGASIRAVAHIEERRRLLMMASVVSSAIVLHNIPEGMATYVASFHSISAGAPLAVAIAIHNIPEGLAVAVPIAYATKNNARAVGLGALSGLSEPFGALLASLVANENSSTGVFGAMFGLTGGMMMYVCIAELLPAAYSERGVPREAVTAAFFGGCLVMAASLVIEKYAAAT